MTSDLKQRTWRSSISASRFSRRDISKERAGGTCCSHSCHRPREYSTLAQAMALSSLRSARADIESSAWSRSGMTLPDAFVCFVSSPMRRRCHSGGGAFDAFVCLETLEHLRQPHAVTAEMSRVGISNAVLLLTTPPRWRFAVTPGPHFGIRGLVLLPPRLQRMVAARRGFCAPEHYVDRIYGSVKQIARTLTPFIVERVLSRSRMPQRWFWDAIILRKRA
jgi:hypothetical protein